MNVYKLSSLILVALLIMLTPSQAISQEKGTSELDIPAHLARANKLLEYNGITRAAKLYEDVLRAEPTRYPDVAFVLGQIYEYKEEPGRATLFYATYLALGDDESQTQHAREAIARLRQPDWPRLYIDPPKEVTGQITINDLYIISDASCDVELFLPQAEYAISVRLDDHHRESYLVDLTRGGISLQPRPESFVFFGYMNLRITNHDDARITITQERADTSDGVIPTQHFVGAPKRAIELPSGVYFIEITDPDHDRWIRRVKIERDLDADVFATLTRALPAEIRFDDIREEEMRGIIKRDAMRTVLKAAKKANATSSKVARGVISREQALEVDEPAGRVVAIY